MNITSAYPTISNYTRTLNRDLNQKLLTNKWMGLYFLYTNYSDGSVTAHSELLLLKLSLETIIKELPLEEIRLYVLTSFGPGLNPNASQAILTEILKNTITSEPSLIKFHNLANRKGTKMSIVHNLLKENINIIILNPFIGCQSGRGKDISLSLSSEFNIWGKEIDSIVSNLAYAEISKKFNINQFISTDFMVVPSNNTSLAIFEKAYELAKLLNNTNKEDIINNVSIAVINSKMGGIIKLFDQSSPYQYLINYTYDTHTKNSLRELRLNHGFNIPWNKYIRTDNNPNLKIESDFHKLIIYETIDAKISYTHPDYIYYPYLDLNIENKTKMNEYSVVFNSNGFSYDPNLPIYS